MWWEKSKVPDEWIFRLSPYPTQGRIGIRIRHDWNGWSCRPRKTAANDKERWTPITADSLEEAQAVALALYRMGAL